MGLVLCTTMVLSIAVNNHNRRGLLHHTTKGNQCAPKRRFSAPTARKEGYIKTKPWRNKCDKSYDIANTEFSSTISFVDVYVATRPRFEESSRIHKNKYCSAVDHNRRVNIGFLHWQWTHSIGASSILVNSTISSRT